MLTDERLIKIQEVVQNRQEGIVVLEDIYDPHNAEAVFRSCDAFGFQKVYLIFDQQKPFNPKRVGQATSSSANKWVDFKMFSTAVECYAELKREGYEIIATVLDKNSVSLFETTFKESKIALVLGNENRGLSQEAIRRADRRITIPMKGMIQSLNLSVTGSICLYEITRQRNTLGLDNYLLSETKQSQLEESFVSR